MCSAASSPAAPQISPDFRVTVRCSKTLYSPIPSRPRSWQFSELEIIAEKYH